MTGDERQMDRTSRTLMMLRTGGLALATAWGVVVFAGSTAYAVGRTAPEGGTVIEAQFRDDQPRGYDDQRRGYDSQRRGDDDRRRGNEDQRRGDERRGGYEPQRGGRGGSYQQSCDNIRQQGSVLTAVCGAGRDRHVESSLDLSRCGGGDIGNIGGYLTCGNNRGNGRRID